MKIICLSIGLLVGLSGLAGIAASHRQAQASSPMGLQTAQGSVAAGTVFRKIAAGY